MYGLSCARSRDEGQTRKNEIRAIEIEPANIRPINFEIRCALIRLSIWLFLVATELQQRYNLSVECALLTVNARSKISSQVLCDQLRHERGEITNAVSTNRDSRPVAVATGRTRNPSNCSAPRDSERDRDRHQAS